MPLVQRWSLAAAAAAAFAASAMPAGAALILHKVLPYSVAKDIAEGAIAACAAKGYATSAVVVDADGETMVLMRGDNASPLTVENARRKAYTSTMFKQTTAEYAKKYNDGNPTTRQQVTLPSVIAIPGGVPIKAGDDVIGGVGLSGSPGVDEDCVNAGLDKVKDQLQ
jgi:uncharacterized protein GlcG (DUF336 family)